MEKNSGFVVVKFVFVLFCFCCVQCYGHGIPVKHISTDPPEFRDKLQRILLSILFGGVTGLVSALVCACLVRCIFWYIKRTPVLKGPVVFSPKISPKTLQSALANENQLLGCTYYKTVIDNGLTVAIKKLESGSPEAQRKSVGRRKQRELEILASLRNRNLMSLRAYVCEPDRFYLVYDYVATGSLEDVMKKVKENQLQLGWDVRLRIAVGIVKGLQYLHFTCTPRILHYNLKPSNVMLDAGFEPRLGDCGLAMLTTGLDTRSSAYCAPECFQDSSVYSDKSDIFSFGVILGMLLTSRDASSNMRKWLRHVVEAGDVREALDKNLLGEEAEEDEMLMAVRIAAVCLSDVPADRLSSHELVQMLTQLDSF